LESILDRWCDAALEIDVRLRDPAIRAWVDASQLDSIATAIIQNAIDAASHKRLRLLINSASTTSDDTIVLTFEDNGSGMVREVLDRAFDPFFSHRSAGRGRGLGLSTARRLAEINGGSIRLDSAPDAGTRVHLTLRQRSQNVAPTNGRKRPAGRTAFGN
jgi:signal transduction histidine kinase